MPYGCRGMVVLLPAKPRLPANLSPSRLHQLRDQAGAKCRPYAVSVACGIDNPRQSLSEDGMPAFSVPIAIGKP